MQNLSDKELDDLFKNLAENPDIQFEEEAWAQMEKKLNKAKWERYIFYLKRGCWGLAGLLVISSTVFMTGHFTGNKDASEAQYETKYSGDRNANKSLNQSETTEEAISEIRDEKEGRANISGTAINSSDKQNAYPASSLSRKAVTQQSGSGSFITGQSGTIKSRTSNGASSSSNSGLNDQAYLNGNSYNNLHGKVIAKLPLVKQKKNLEGKTTAGNNRNINLFADAIAFEENKNHKNILSAENESNYPALKEINADEKQIENRDVNDSGRVNTKDYSKNNNRQISVGEMRNQDSPSDNEKNSQTNYPDDTTHSDDAVKSAGGQVMLKELAYKNEGNFALKDSATGKASVTKVSSEKAATNDILSSQPHYISQVNKEDSAAVNADSGLVRDGLLNQTKRRSESKERASLRRTISLGALFAPDFSSVGFFHWEKPGISKGIVSEYHIHPRWSVSTGAILTSKIYSTTNVEGYAYGYGYQKIKLTRVDGKCSVLDIPLNIRYNIHQSGKNNFYCSAGVSSYFMLYEKYSFEYQNSWYNYSKECRNRNRNIFSILNGAIGYERYISQSFSIQAEPFIKIPLKNVGQQNLKLLTTGVFFYLKYTIR